MREDAILKSESLDDRRTQMPVYQVLVTLSWIAAIIVPLCYLTNSAADGWSLLWTIVLVWVSFAVVMGIGAPVSIIVWAILAALLALLRLDDKERVFRIVRWCIVVAGGAAFVVGGGLLIVSGWTNNRMQTVEVLYERCMQPITMTNTGRYKACADGWRSESIGRRGACSHHGGVIERYMERRTTAPPHSTEYCRVHAEKRSWRN